MNDDRFRGRLVAVLLMIALWIACALVHAQEQGASNASTAPVNDVEKKWGWARGRFGPSVANVCDDRITEALSGKIQYEGDGRVHGVGGQGFLLSGRTGCRRIVLAEHNHPTISLEHSLALHEK